MIDHLHELMKVFWLRPETALWRACDIAAMSGFEVRSPSLDLGCGDGIFSFIRAGGQFQQEFDAFKSLGDLGQFFAKVDIFNHYTGPLGDVVMRAPDYQFDFGFDHKEALLKKSADLGLYRELRLGDGNGPLPFESNTFNAIFSNIVYWLDNPSHVLGEINRILRPGALACVMLPDETLPDFSFYQRFYKATSDERYAFLDLLDRGRLSDNVRQSKSDTAWREIFSTSGLEVARHTRHLSGALVQMWDVGFRPMFPLLKKITDKLAQDDLMNIKAEWISTLELFARPLLASEQDRSSPTFHCYILRKP